MEEEPKSNAMDVGEDETNTDGALYNQILININVDSRGSTGNSRQLLDFNHYGNDSVSIQGVASRSVSLFRGAVENQRLNLLDANKTTANLSSSENNIESDEDVIPRSNDVTLGNIDDIKNTQNSVLSRTSKIHVYTENNTDDLPIESENFISGDMENILLECLSDCTNIESTIEIEKDIIAHCIEGVDGTNDGNLSTHEVDYEELEREFLFQCTNDNNEVDGTEIKKGIVSNCLAVSECAKNNIEDVQVRQSSNLSSEKTSAKKVIVSCLETGHENSITLYFEKQQMEITNANNNELTKQISNCDEAEDVDWLYDRDAEDPDDPSKRFGCIQCDYKTRKMGNLKEHMKNIHNKKTAETFHCPQCDFKTVYRRNLTFHSRVHNRLQNLHCDVCDKDFNRKNNLDSHILRHHPNDVHLVTSKFYTCQNCDFKTLRKNELALHMITHSKKVAQSFSCQQCTYTTYYKSAMTRHMAIHSTKKPHVCKGCDKDFSQKLHLYAHILNHHTDDKELSASILCKIHCCDYCEYRCVFAHTFKLHLRTHNIE